MDVVLLAGTSNRPLAMNIARELAVPLGRCTTTRFADGERHVRLDEPIRGSDVYVVQPTSRPVDEHLLELLLLGDACVRAGAGRLTAVVPYFGYARQDRRSGCREPVGAALVARVIEAAGFSRVVAVDLHSPEIEGFFRIPLEHLTAAPLLAAAVHASSDSVIVAPDLGAVKLAERYQAILGLPVVVLHKTRVTGSDVLVRSIIGDISGRRPLIVDDMITTAGTIEAAVHALVAAGCTPEATIVAAHPILAGNAVERLQRLPVRHTVATDSVETGALPATFRIVNLAPLLADTIRRLHGEQTLEPLLAHA